MLLFYGERGMGKVRNEIQIINFSSAIFSPLDTAQKVIFSKYPSNCKSRVKI